MSFSQEETLSDALQNAKNPHNTLQLSQEQESPMKETSADNFDDWEKHFDGK